MYNAYLNLLFDAGHLFSKPIHTGICRLASFWNAPLSTQKAIHIAHAFFETLVGTVLAIPSLLFSSLGALSMAVASKKHLITSNQLNNNQLIDRANKILSYNVGLLPGYGMITARHDLSDRNAVHERIASYIIRQFEEHPIILLQEAVDRGFITLLEKKLKDQNKPFALYSRIGNPLDLGIPSGLAVLSTGYLSNFEVIPLRPHPGLARAAASFNIKNLADRTMRVITAHLSPGDDNDSAREEQMQTLFNFISRSSDDSFLFIGDFNFSAEHAYNQKKCMLPIPFTFQNYIEQPTCDIETDNPTQPDLVGALYQKEALRLNVTFPQDPAERAYDHIPISAELSPDQAAYANASKRRTMA